MTTPLLSVVVPAYNNGSTLQETLQSILTQSVDGGMEVIVADHSSTDDSAAVLARFAGDERLRVLSPTPNGGGAPRNWNRVTEAASGRFLKLVCGDDVVRDGTLQRQASLLEESGAVLTACRRDVVDASGRTLVAGWGLRGLDERMPGSVAVRKAIRAGSNLFGEPASVMMRRQPLADAGGWKPDFPYLIDQASYSQVLFSGDFIPDLEVGATFRMSATQWSVALVREQSSQAQAFHEWIHREHPDAVTRADVRFGNTRAALMARARRLSYKVLQRRMG